MLSGNLAVVVVVFEEELAWAGLALVLYCTLRVPAVRGPGTTYKIYSTYQGAFNVEISPSPSPSPGLVAGIPRFNRTCTGEGREGRANCAAYRGRAESSTLWYHVRSTLGTDTPCYAVLRILLLYR